ncbi:MAG: MarR family winged helix-turn-helix transcriptional regulator [Thermocrispum sp.]
MRMPFDERLGSDIKRVEQELMRAKSGAVRPAGLTVPQYAALFVLQDNAGISAAELARKCLVTPQTMTTVLRGLEAAGLVERSQHPWHRNVLETRLTPDGLAALDRADVRAAAIERRLEAEFSSAERDQLRALLARCSQVLTAPEDETARR